MTPAPLDGHETVVPTHRCRHCGAGWRLNAGRPDLYPPDHPFHRETWTITPGGKSCIECEHDTLKACSDAVHHPRHYTQGKVECIDALEAATVELVGIEAVCTAAAVKYLWRWKRKNGAEDLKKARWYIDRLLAHLETPEQVPSLAEALERPQPRPLPTGVPGPRARKK
jgi:hypothetical protein